MNERVNEIVSRIMRDIQATVRNLPDDEYLEVLEEIRDYTSDYADARRAEIKRGSSLP